MKPSKESSISNPFQGEYKKILCVCSAGILRSATAAVVLSQPPFNANTRACGIEDIALIRLDEHLVRWADEIVCMERKHTENVLKLLKKMDRTIRVITLEIPDTFNYRDPELMNLIKEKYLELEKTCLK